MPDWPGEIEFYRSLARKVKEQGVSILEVGCGTGRVTLQLAQEGFQITGMDLSPAMLNVARPKSRLMQNIRWIEGDMQSFAIGECFDLIIFPGHSFQFMLSPEEQIACLNCVRHHLSSSGKLVVHNNFDDLGWLGSLAEGRNTDFTLKGEYILDNQQKFRAWTSWGYDPCTQTATARDAWDLFGEEGKFMERIESFPKHLHCIFRSEMEHLLARAGFRIEALYGDFFQNTLLQSSSDMIWVASLKAHQPVYIRTLLRENL